MLRFTSLALCGALAAAVFCAAAVAEDYYHPVTNLGAIGTVGGNKVRSYGFAVNDVGQVVGHNYDLTSYKQFGYVHDNGTMTALSPSAGGLYPWTADDINNSGTIVGSLGTYGERVYVRNGTTVTDLGKPTAGCYMSSASAVNNSGTIVGWGFESMDEDDYIHAFIYKSSTGYTLLNSAFGGRTCEALDVNNNGQVVIATSASTSSYERTRAFIYDNGATIALPALTGASGFSRAEALNDVGQAVGSSQGADGRMHACLWNFSGGAPAAIALGSLGGTVNNGFTESVAYGINNSGQAVGFAYTSLTAYRAFVYCSDVGMVNLNSLIDPDSGWVLLEANDVNEYGLVTGTGYFTDGGVQTIRAYTIRAALPGDANLDGLVDFDDLTTLINHYGQSAGSNWLTADFNEDGLVDFDDLTALINHYGGVLGSSTGSSNMLDERALGALRTLGVSVPEPGTFALLAAGLLGLLAYVWHKRR